MRRAQDQDPRTPQSFGAKAGAATARPRHRCRRIAGGDRRLRHGQVGAAQVHPRPDPSPTPAAIMVDGRRSSALRRRATRDAVHAQVRHAVPGRRAVRSAAGLGERRLRADRRAASMPRDAGQGARDRESRRRSGSGAEVADSARPSSRAACRSAWPRARHRRPIRRSSSSTSRPPASTRSWPT